MCPFELTISAEGRMKPPLPVMSPSAKSASSNTQLEQLMLIGPKLYMNAPPV